MWHLYNWSAAYMKKKPYPEKNGTKGFLTVYCTSGVLNNISKVYQDLTMQKVSFSRWRPKWTQNP